MGNLYEFYTFWIINFRGWRTVNICKHIRSCIIAILTFHCHYFRAIVGMSVIVIHIHDIALIRLFAIASYAYGNVQWLHVDTRWPGGLPRRPLQ